MQLVLRSRRKCNWNSVVNAVRDWFDYVVNGRGGWRGVRDDQSNVAIGRYYRKWWKLHSKDYHRFLADGDLCGRYQILFGEERSFCKGRRRLMIQEVTLENITKQIGKTTVLTDICLTMKCGQICGITGENGSGKTMLMRVIAGLVSPSTGKLLFDGKNRADANPNIGIMIENASLYPELSGRENLRLLASIRKQATNEDIDRAIRRVGLEPTDKRTFRKYSLGMKQRLMLAQAIMEQPDVLLLDEPTNAIDKKGVELVHQIMSEEASRGAIVLLASHVDYDIRSLCSKVFLIEKGKMQLEV